MEKDKIAKLSDKDLLGLFVSAIGYDYRNNLHPPHIHPEFSDDTVALWTEVESRMKESTVLDFDRDGCLNKIKQEVAKQSDILKGGPDYASSYHYGIRSGLNITLGIIENCIVAHDDA